MTHSKRVAIIGGGPGGSALAIHLARRGIPVEIIEKAQFPREHIGESLSGECLPLLRELGMMPFLDSRCYPNRHGVKVYGKDGKNAFWVPVVIPTPDGGRVATSVPQVRRSEFDSALLDAARDAGALVRRAEARDVLRDDSGRITGLCVQNDDGTTDQVKADFIVDASGQSTFLSRIGVAGTRDRAAYSKQVSFYGQFEGCQRHAPPDDGNTHIFYAQKHHWAWFIPISDTVTSVGVVVPGATYKASGQSPQAFLLDRLKDLNPKLANQMAQARLTSEVWRTSNYSYSVQDFTGPQYLCLGDAYRFIDPIFSFGVFTALKQASLAAPLIEKILEGAPETAAPLIAHYRDTVSAAQDRLQTLIDTFWDFPLAFLKLAHFDKKEDVAELFSGRIFNESAVSVEAMQMMEQLQRNKKVA